MAEGFLDGRVTLEAGDCLEVLKTIPDNSLDSCVTDPPYHLTSIVKRFGGSGAYGGGFKATGNGTGAAFARMSRGFMGKQWDGGDIAFRIELWVEVYRVLKPGAHLVAFSGTRTYHRMAVAIEDAGFEIRDQIGWLYGSGFPKSHDVAHSINKAARGVPHGGADPTSPNHGKYRTQATEGKRSETDAGQGFGAGPGQFMREAGEKNQCKLCDEAMEWQGWGTALKPAWEPIVLARKPLVGTVAENVLQHGTGAINIEGCRVELTGDTDPRLGGKGDWSTAGMAKNVYEGGYAGKRTGSSELGRWPANVIHDGSDEVVAAFPSAPGQIAPVGPANGAKPSVNVYGDYGPREQSNPRNDSGSAARFFYTAKADAYDRAGSKHPTVKPLDLMQYLVRLVTPRGGTTLDPFAGTGTTGEAAWREGMKCILIEREEEYQNDIRRRMKLAAAGPDERAREGLKAAGKANEDPGPLFAGLK